MYEEAPIPSRRQHPPLDDLGPEFDAFVEDIKRIGLWDKIVLYEGKILDGRRRYLACKQAGVEPRFLAWDGKGSPVDYVISVNVHRRHLSKGQLAALALRLLPSHRDRGKARQKLSKGRGRKGAKSCATTTGKATEQVAKKVGCSARLVEMLEKVQDVRPELVSQVETDKISVTEAYAIAAGRTKGPAGSVDDWRNQDWESKPTLTCLHSLGSRPMVFPDPRAARPWLTE